VAGSKYSIAQERTCGCYTRMKEETHQLLSKAERAIAAAQHLSEIGDIEFAIGRSYYAMFYIAEALLNEKDLRYSKHGGVHGAFGEYFVKTGLFDQRYHRWLLSAFNRRIVGDYGIEAVLTPEEVVETIFQAREFLNEARLFLRNFKP
jgi:uncharacterized protein (UPF0332 family)